MINVLFKSTIKTLPSIKILDTGGLIPFDVERLACSPIFNEYFLYPRRFYTLSGAIRLDKNLFRLKKN